MIGRQDARGNWSSGFKLGAFSQDIRYSLRQLSVSPRFAVTVIFTLALGIGAVTAVFSIIYRVLINPSPYRDVNTLATPDVCFPDSPCGWVPYEPWQFIRLEENSHVFSAVAGYLVTDVVITKGASRERASGSYMTPNTLEVLGLHPLSGRNSMEDDVKSDTGQVVLLSYNYWHLNYSDKRSALGKVLYVDDQPRTIIGIMAPRDTIEGADLYLPVSMSNQVQIAAHRTFMLLGRVRRGVTDAEAAAEFQPAFDEFSKRDPLIYPKHLKLGLTFFPQILKSDLENTLYLLLLAVFILLIIACVNVSNILLARAVNRETEFVIRAAVGASRLRLIQQSITESLLLAFIALPLAFIVAYMSVRLMLRVVPTDTLPDTEFVVMNVPVLLSAISVCLLTVLMCGLAPILHSMSPRLATALNSARSSLGRTQRRILSGLIVWEVALSFALLALAALMIHSFILVVKVPIPLPPDRTLLLRFPPTDTQHHTPTADAEFLREWLERVRDVPGVELATVDVAFPVVGIFTTKVQVEASAPDSRKVSVHLTDPGYLALSGRMILQGHFLNNSEIVGHAHDIVVSESFAKRYFPSGSAVGSRIELPELTSTDQKSSFGESFMVVGVMTNFPQTFKPQFRDYPDICLAYTVNPSMVSVLIVKTKIPAAQLDKPVRNLVYSLNRLQGIQDGGSLAELLDKAEYAGPRFAVALFVVFAVAGLLLSFVGIYGVLMFINTQRTHELGIRMALGATRSDILWMLLRQILTLSIFGVLVGLPLAALAANLARGQLFQISPYDPVAIVVPLCALPMLAAAATMLQARKIVGINPANVLRGR